MECRLAFPGTAGQNYVVPGWLESATHQDSAARYSAIFSCLVWESVPERVYRPSMFYSIRVSVGEL